MAETLFMVHGMWCGGWIWKNHLRHFGERGFACVAPSLPHHDVKADDPPHPALGTLSLFDYVDFLEKEIRALGRPPVLVGHSMGGLLAQLLAARGMGKALVLLSPAPPAGIFALKPSVIRCFAEGLTTWGFWKKPFRPSAGKIIEAMFHLTPEEDRKEYFSKMSYESGRASAEIGFWAFDRRGAARVDETKVTVPTLVVVGNEDQLTPPGVVRQIAAKYGARYREFEKHAHNIMGEPGWEEIADFIHSWLRETLPAPPGRAPFQPGGGDAERARAA